MENKTIDEIKTLLAPYVEQQRKYQRAAEMSYCRKGGLVILASPVLLLVASYNPIGSIVTIFAGMAIFLSLIVLFVETVGAIQAQLVYVDNEIFGKIATLHLTEDGREDLVEILRTGEAVRIREMVTWLSSECERVKKQEFLAHPGVVEFLKTAYVCKKEV